jgi:cysteine-rich repeat protein
MKNLSISSKYAGLGILVLLVGGLILFGMPDIAPGPSGNPCGNGILDPGEQCDDGNLINGDGCSATCELEGGGEGCTPGFWKNPKRIVLWPAPYTPAVMFSAVFEDAFPGMTLLDVLKQGGGGLKALGRHTVAALLSAASPSVSYDLTVSQIISMFNDEYPGGDYTGLKNTLVYFNELGCEID